MMAIHLAHPYFGYPRMQTALQEASYLVNHKKVWRLMKEYIYFYNYQRFQAKLKQRVPIEYRHALAA